MITTDASQMTPQDFMDDLEVFVDMKVRGYNPPLTKAVKQRLINYLYRIYETPSNTNTTPSRHASC